ncbi:prolipoprotein diacylglyceryl transferase [Tuberibacillus sp. Marseille-P3662]|uniref:prolipoprotein diacylglyceryl transferase n=1 Tax=Tuberibacillus sp. Marseille-P3662 TaxID=1965358 RepID=UPI000A1CAEC8|nr:prolipoprotein diacylglyceryl transferase [Tuberibacillus sp. Marseille-P3662]
MNQIEPLDRTAFELGPISVYWYGIIIAFGALLGLLIAVKESRRRGFPQDAFVDLVLFAIPISIICARAYYVVFKWEYYSHHLSEIVAVWHGGIAIHGALIGAVLTAIIYCKVKGYSFWSLADIAAPSIILGQGIGRWGNFMNQEAHGGEVSRAFLENLHLPDFIVNQMFIDGAYYAPTFLYESVWDILGFVILVILWRVNLGRGEVFLSYIIWYSIGRFFIEGMRTDSLMLTDTLRMAQAISIALIILAIVLWIYRRMKGYSKTNISDE